MNRKKKFWVIAGIFILAGAAVVTLAGIAIQFVPYGRDHTNPPVAAEPNWDNPRTRELFFRACKDCHSNETVWPWYSNVAPVSWLISRDVTKGREEFNISERGSNSGREAAELIQEGEMPPWFYLPLHPEATLSIAEKEALMSGLTATFGEE